MVNKREKGDNHGREKCAKVKKILLIGGGSVWWWMYYPALQRLAGKRKICWSPLKEGQLQGNSGAPTVEVTVADTGDLRAVFEPFSTRFVRCQSGTEWSDPCIPQAIRAGEFNTIIIATPPQFHMETFQNIAPLVAQAPKEKKVTIYVEKPIDVSVSRVRAALSEVQELKDKGHCVRAIDHYRYKWVTLWLRSCRNNWNIGCLERAYFVSYEPQEIAPSEAFRFGYLIEHGSRALSVLQAMSKKRIDIIGASVKTVDEETGKPIPILGFRHLRAPAECERDTAAMVTLTVHAKDKKCESFKFPFTIAVGKGMGEKWKGKWLRLEGSEGTVCADINNDKVYFQQKGTNEWLDTPDPKACEPTEAYDVLLRMMLCLKVPCFKRQDVPHFLSVEEAMGFLQPIQEASDSLKAYEAYRRYDPGNPPVEMQDILSHVKPK